MRSLQIAAGLFAFAGAGFWVWSSLIKVPDNIDTFVSVLQHQGRINAAAAIATALSAVLQGAVLFGGP